LLLVLMPVLLAVLLLVLLLLLLLLSMPGLLWACLQLRLVSNRLVSCNS
jgi:hypothetical protein